MDGYKGYGKVVNQPVTKTDKAKQPTPVEEYVPDDMEQRMLDVLLDPFHRMASVTKQCELIGISRQTYYQHMKKKEFAAYYTYMCRETIKHRAGELVNIGIREARKGGHGSFGYWKELSKMAGIIDDDKVNVELDGEVEITVRFAPPGESDE